MKHPKPGKPKKKKRKKIPVPKEKHCRKCNRITKKECWRHAESTKIKMLSGGGITSGKINDDKTAWLCMTCDNEMSTKPNKDDLEAVFIHDTEWELLIKLSH